MPVAVYDTYVRRKDGTVMHFDILVPATLTNLATIHGYGHAYLHTKGQEGQPLTAEECRLCHLEQATPLVQADLDRQGYHIIEMSGCQ